MSSKLSCAMRSIVGAGALCLSLAAGAADVDVFVGDITQVNANAYSGNLDVIIGPFVDTVPFLVSKNGAGVITVQSPGSHWLAPLSNRIGIVPSGGWAPPPGGGDLPPIRPNAVPIIPLIWNAAAACAAGMATAHALAEVGCRGDGGGIANMSYGFCGSGWGGAGASFECRNPPKPPAEPDPGNGNGGGGGSGGGHGGGPGSGGAWSIPGAVDVDIVSGTVTVGKIVTE